MPLAATPPPQGQSDFPPTTLVPLWKAGHAAGECRTEHSIHAPKEPLPIRLLLTVSAPLALSLRAQAETTETAHAHFPAMTGAEQQIYDGYFEDAQIQPRPLADWQGDCWLVCPLLMVGTR